MRKIIGYERGLYFIAGDITFYSLFENVIYRPKSIFVCDTTVLSRPLLIFHPLVFLHQTLNHNPDVYHSAIVD